MFENNYNSPLLQNPYLMNPADQLKQLDAQRIALQQGSAEIMAQQNRTPVWDSIDNEVSVLSDEQKELMLRDDEYKRLNDEVMLLLRKELMKLVKPSVERSEHGKELLERLLNCTRRVKGAVLTESRAEMDEFRKWKANKNKKTT